MAAWTTDELARIGEAEELPLGERAGSGLVPRYPGAPRGSHPGRRQREERHRRGRRPRIADELDAAYRTKYCRYAASIVDAVNGTDARAATLRLEPR